ncbi:uncharacterized protein LOC117299147 [Asterias rubens]|uniref:uncharacterized protein LOC117299147 n=1 Tax=Asterias rubens TaxID=7604 RepID=UPI0014555E35|nr:uncharacterized protein LOC117299147 [Asterias rubens]
MASTAFNCDAELYSKTKLETKLETMPKKQALAEFCKANRKTLFGKAGHCSNRVEVRKQTCWLEAVEVIRAAGGPQIRKWDAIRKKWNELKVQAHKYQLKKSVTGTDDLTKNFITLRSDRAKKFSDGKKAHRTLYT